MSRARGFQKSQKTAVREDESPISSTSYESDDTLIGASCSDLSSTDPSSDDAENGKFKKNRKSELHCEVEKKSGSVSNPGMEITGKGESLRAAPENVGTATALKNLEEQYEKACEASTEDSSPLSDEKSASAKASSKNVKRTKSLERKLDGQSGKDEAGSNNEEEKDYVRLCSLGSKCEELLSSESKIPLAWSSDSEVNFRHLLEFEKDKNQMSRDIFVLIGFFVEFGPVAFNRVKLNRLGTKEATKLKELVNKYNLFEGEKSKITIQRIVALCPCYVAEHLHSFKGEIIGNRFALPRCYAFIGGFDLIPPNDEYLNLRDVWCLYESSFKKSFTQFWKWTEYMTLNYAQTDNSVKLLFLNTYNITVPTEREIFDSVAVEMKMLNIEQSGKSFTLENFKRLCCRNTSDTFVYYERLRKKLTRRK